MSAITMNEFWTLVSRHSNGLEIFQTLAALFGVAFSFWALIDAIKDSMALSMSGINGGRRTIASGNVFTEIERLLIHSILFMVGFSSIFLAPPMWPNQPVQAPELMQHTLTRLGMVAITAIKVNGALRSRRERVRFVRQMRFVGSKSTRAELAPPPGHCRRNSD